MTKRQATKALAKLFREAIEEDCRKLERELHAREKVDPRITRKLEKALKRKTGK